MEISEVSANQTERTQEPTQNSSGFGRSESYEDRTHHVIAIQGQEEWAELSALRSQHREVNRRNSDQKEKKRTS